MSEETPTSPTAEERIKERHAFNSIADAMESLSADGRMRVFRLLADHFSLQFERSGIATTAATVPAYGDTRTPNSFSEDRSLSPKQFMLEKRPQTDIERIACLAYYLAHYRDQPHFKTIDLSKLNTEAAQTKLANASKTSDNAVARNMLVQVGGGKRQISALGELYVQALPDREAAKAAVAHARPRRKAGRTPKGPELDAPSDDE